MKLTLFGTNMNDVEWTAPGELKLTGRERVMAAFEQAKPGAPGQLNLTSSTTTAAPVTPLSAAPGGKTGRARVVAAFERARPGTSANGQLPPAIATVPAHTITPLTAAPSGKTGRARVVAAFERARPATSANSHLATALATVPAPTVKPLNATINNAASTRRAKFQALNEKMIARQRAKPGGWTPAEMRQWEEERNAILASTEGEAC
ncbi:MAG: hypothetical protein WCO56_28145 [Verrucomicrobiota bacterium]